MEQGLDDVLHAERERERVKKEKGESDEIDETRMVRAKFKSSSRRKNE